MTYSSSLGPQTAKDLVQQIAKEHGYVSEEDWERIPPDIRPIFKDALHQKDLMAGATVITLAKNLYSSKARFIFEVLQNADDNHYSRATASGYVPFVSFRAFPCRIVIECNEDGFTHENLRAICSIGNSSKTGAQGYIGEKGIGFKSVFMVAWKAHIQSGDFSFSFTHKEGDSGMGMISPVWEETDEELDPLLTRITLYLHDTGENTASTKVREAVQAQFEELQESVLLFLKNIRKIDVGFYDEKEQRTNSVTYELTRPQRDRAVLRTCRIDTTNGMPRIETKQFHVTPVKATNLAPNENRTYSDAEEKARAYSESEVVLAFPLSEASVPIVEPQQVFAFLPVRPVGFKFLIQGDFVTDANRQDVVKDAHRNLDLLEAAAKAFVIAARQFCRHKTLRYQWIKYLPQRDVSWDPFWRILVDKITEEIRSAPAFYDHKGSSLRRLRELFRVGPIARDEHGEPLFDDGNPGQIISRRYSEGDLDVLENSYGLQKADYARIVSWLKADLRDAVSSRMKSPDSTESWHQRAAIFLNEVFARKMSHITTDLEEMDLIPLEDGSWTSASSGPVYFADIDGLKIPRDIGLRLLSNRIKDTQRLDLFTSLGVVTAPSNVVHQKIIDHYKTGLNPNFSIQASNDHLRFLYMTETLIDEEVSYQDLSLFDHVGMLGKPSETYMYLSSDDKSGPFEVFKQTKPGPNPGDSAPGYYKYVSFVSDEYFANEPVAPDGQKMSWRAWFSKRLDVETHIDFSSYSLELKDVPSGPQYVQQYRPEKFLRCLLDWYSPSNAKRLPTDSIKCLQDTEVLCRGNRKVRFKDCYFPTQTLEERVSRFVGEDAFFPWLWLETREVHEIIPPKWKLLFSKLGVGQPPSDLDFALVMLKYFRDARSTCMTSTNEDKLFALYQHIQIQYQESKDRDVAGEQIRNAFKKTRCIYIPLTGGRCKWALPNECVWSAPQDMKTKFALQRLYKTWLKADSISNSIYLDLFGRILDIGNCTWDILVGELKKLKASKCSDIDTIGEIYRALDGLSRDLSRSEMNKLKKQFENEALIFLPLADGVSWHKPPQCVWSTAHATRLRGRVSLNDVYKTLDHLFVRVLGVEELVLAMAVDELKETAATGLATASEMKDSIWAVNSLLDPAQDIPSSRDMDLSKARIFPVAHPNGRVTLETAATSFCITDRQSLRSAFEDNVKLLDFELEQVALLRPFIEWTQLEDRYLSRCVKNVTSFHGGAESLVSNPQRQIRYRANALLRVAAHFGSPRCRGRQDADSLYGLLRSAEVFENDNISSDLSLEQDGTPHVVEGKKATMHIEGTETSLKIYVPGNEDDQEYILKSLLPEKLLEWIMADPKTNAPRGIAKSAVIATKDLISVPVSMITRALDDNGISTVEVENVDDIMPLPSDDGPEYWEADAVISTTPQTPFIVDSQVRYKTLLDKIVAAGRRERTNALPFATSGLQVGLQAQGGYTDFGLSSMTSLERDMKIGAAGELFVFEFLSHLSENGMALPPLPGFSRDNWQSNIRGYVNVHPDYEGMEPWIGFETSDMVYEDRNNSLTTLLFNNGYLTLEAWLSMTRCLTYYIEVKTTTMCCETPFYMSPAQYERMRSSVLTEASEAVYVIFRVYNLGQQNMGLKIYMDPETLRLNEKLDFTAEKWSVVPR